ncbi:IS3 family transposase [Pigmentibacter sp. JX0631]|uniref:IS3 family transposase n=1 Tax=Pigmentibacter sp. JX0631 TaxID=2976982 RepID=UPI002468B485|nr:IS3 family transposase [Pigmentibacter sp. JX0631]WGL58828.1 IS3 family transposase [Pigmentibacter sp. JX0631]
MRNYLKDEASILLPMIRNTIETRSTYGYKIITAMVNNIFHGNNRKVNKKRIYRIIKINGLLLPKNEIQRKSHTGTGKIITLHSNTHWCSDAFEIMCFNDETVYVAFSLDCRDRGAISYVATKEPL